MSAPKSIIWLASYPKSGNTWTRIFLANYLMNADKPVPINQVHRFGMGDSIPRMYHMVAGRQIDISDYQLTLKLRDKVLGGIVANKADVNFVKTHNIRAEAFGVTLIPERFTRSAIYIIRNPLDMLISFARHYGLGHAETADAISSPDHSNSADGSTVTQFLGSWSEHVESWTTKSPYPVCVLRYEDMLADPEVSFAKVLDLVGIPNDPERLKKAIRFSSFDELSKQEEEGGFVESSPKNDRFFSKGQSNQWQSELAPEIVERVKKDHRKIMKKYGYLDD
ncbi:sulfotransferase domain-containing protein [Roseovarius sp.]|uniref:sulfotransferase domain-containing protein n=1 Tax=Roseovarius sp. TaxID=1486281 RepID=UPI00262F09A6|nr:sulfotransferase domain-containing protein [Roseovarius sp.]MDM8165245.1 sulfotransferase domain-containing protein [Roseovarius sp.]